MAELNDLIKDISGFVTNPVGSALSGAVNFVTGLFGGNEDKSTIGFQKFLSTGGTQGVVPPPKDEIIYWGQQAGWAQDTLNAIFNTYQQSDGTFKKGDWNGIVISTWPITVKLFKGSGEAFTLATTDYFQPDIGNHTASQTTANAAAGAVNSPVPGKTSQPLTNLISGVSDQILGNETFNIPNTLDYAAITKRITDDILKAQNKGSNSSQGTIQTQGAGSSMTTWLIIAAAAVGIYFLTSKKRS